MLPTLDIASNSLFLVKKSWIWAPSPDSFIVFVVNVMRVHLPWTYSIVLKETTKWVAYGTSPSVVSLVANHRSQSQGLLGLNNVKRLLIYKFCEILWLPWLGYLTWFCVSTSFCKSQSVIFVASNTQRSSKLRQMIVGPLSPSTWNSGSWRGGIGRCPLSCWVCLKFCIDIREDSWKYTEKSDSCKIYKSIGLNHNFWRLCWFRDLNSAGPA